MTKKMWSLLLTGALIAGVFSAVPAQAAPEVPTAPNVVDPSGDANYLNDQGLAGTGFTGTPAVVPAEGDRSTPADGGSVSDILAIWFTSDADNLYTHIQTEAPGPATAALFYRVTVDPGVGANCLWIQASAPGAGNVVGAGASLRTVAPCEPVETLTEGVEFLQEEGPDGTGIHTIKVPRALSPYLTDGAKLLTPIGQSRHNVSTGTPAGAVAPQIDNTKPGLEFVIGSGGAPTAPPVVSEPPTEEPVQKDCKKIKNKKKRKKCVKEQGSGGDSCAAYEPSEFSKDVPVTVVIDEVTADKPIEIELETPEGLGTSSASGPDGGDGATSHVFVNVQVDSGAPRTGLWSRLEFAPEWDYDLWVRNNDGAAAAGSAGGPPFAGPFDGTGSGGRAELGAENIEGLATNDCQGYLVDIAGATTPGDTVTLKLWLGEIVYDPAAPAKAFVF